MPIYVCADWNLSLPQWILIGVLLGLNIVLLIMLIATCHRLKKLKREGEEGPSPYYSPTIISSPLARPLEEGSFKVQPKQETITETAAPSEVIRRTEDLWISSLSDAALNSKSPRHAEIGLARALSGDYAEPMDMASTSSAMSKKHLQRSSTRSAGRHRAKASTLRRFGSCHEYALPVTTAITAPTTTMSSNASSSLSPTASSHDYMEPWQHLASNGDITEADELDLVNGPSIIAYINTAAKE